MQKLRYLSPTSLDLWKKSRRDFYIQYLADTRIPRPPQTEPMAVGSAFDAYVKSYLVQRLYDVVPPEFKFDTIFEAQVESHNRDVARVDGKYVFDFYEKCGALADILLDLEGAIGKPRFETKIEGYVKPESGMFGDVPLLGKPDIYFITKKGARVIFDWKVNGFYSRHNISPKPGYTRLRCFGMDSGKQHPKAMVMSHEGIKIAASHPFCTVDETWAAQLSIYAWLLGEAIGGKFIVAIDQIACGRDSAQNRTLRVAQHRALVSEKFQRQLFEDAHTAWYSIQSGHIFNQMSREASDAECQMIEEILANPNKGMMNFDPAEPGAFEDICR